MQRKILSLICSSEIFWDIYVGKEDIVEKLLSIYVDKVNVQTSEYLLY